MNPMDWLISLLPHPKRRSRTQRSVKPADAPPAPLPEQKPLKVQPPAPKPPVVQNPALARPRQLQLPLVDFTSESDPNSPPAPRIIHLPKISVLIAAVIGFALIGSVVIALLNSVPDTNPQPPTQQPSPTLAALTTSNPENPSTPTPFQPATRPPNQVIPTPTADAPKPLPTQRAKEDRYVVQSNDTLNIIAKKYNVDVQDLMQANKIANPDRLNVGQTLVIPVVTPRPAGSAYKIIPDSELVRGPYSVGFSVNAVVSKYGGYLSKYEEKVDDIQTSGAGIVERISRDYSVNPRILLAVLEYQSSWLTNPDPPDYRRDYPMGHVNTARKGLYRQLMWAANILNQGYYLWRAGALGSFKMNDGSLVPANNALNAGTAGVQNLMSEVYDRAGWDKAVSEKGVAATYNKLFGYPFDFTFEPLLPASLKQPDFQLPFEDGTVWSFTGAPHGAWGDGSAWGALDFAPPGDAFGCVVSPAWVTAIAPGKVVRSEGGAVVVDLDFDGYEQTGWTLLYLHISSSGKVKLGTTVKTGDRIGHPSCEGGVSNGTHVHIARRYNGEWIPADQDLPFDLDGWKSEGTGVEYYGYLRKGENVVEAWDRRVPANQISR